MDVKSIIIEEQTITTASSRNIKWKLQTTGTLKYFRSLDDKRFDEFCFRKKIF